MDLPELQWALMTDGARQFRPGLPMPKMVPDDHLRALTVPTLLSMAGRSEVYDAQKAATRAEAVVDVTVAGGLAAATFRTVADRAGVSVRLVQYYFGDKAQLLSDTLTYVQRDIAEVVETAIAGLGDGASPRQALQAICEALLPVDERRRRAMHVFVAFGTAALTDTALQGPRALRRGQGLVDVVAQRLREARSDDHVDDDALLLVMTVTGLGNGLLAGDLSIDQSRRILDRALDQFVVIG
ncbi:MAG: TetR family transcriptional regulator C-terminal domain-containing protein [Nitriliruptoraceae bacterium]